MTAQRNEETYRALADRIRQGDTITAACRACGVGRRTFYDWQEDDAHFAHLIKEAADDFNVSIVAQMEQSLYRRANGYEAREIKIERSPDGRERRTVTVKQIAPDTGALVFALTNRAPERWQNRQHTDLTTGGAPLPAVIIGRDPDPLPIASDEAEISTAREEGGER